MGWFDGFFGNSEANRIYGQIRDKNMAKSVEQARQRNIDIYAEPQMIAELIQFPGNVNGEHYWHVADFILAEYETELGLQVSSSFAYLKPKLGFDAHGKIMVGTQFVDRKAGKPTITKLSFMNEHPKAYTYLIEKDCPERTEKAVDLLTAAAFQFPSADHAKKIFPTLLVVPEMEEAVIKRMQSIDKTVAKYITG